MAAVARAVRDGADFKCTVDGRSNGYSPLDWAVLQDSPVLVSSLLEAGIDPDARWSASGDRFPLEEAIEARVYGRPSLHRTEIVALLLRGGADPNARWCPFESRSDSIPYAPACRSETGMTPLVMAVAFDQPDTVALLLAAGADPRLKYGNGQTPLQVTRSVAVLDLLLPELFPSTVDRDAKALDAMRGVDAGGPPGPWQETPLANAIVGGNYVPAPPPPPPPPASSNDVPSPPVRDGRLEVVLTLGADVNERLTWGGVDWTPLALAVTTHKLAAVDRLLARRADPNARWCVPVHLGGNRRIARPVPGCTLRNGTTPLMAAAKMGAIDLIQRLVAAGGDPAAHDWQGKTAFDLAPPSRRTAVNAALRRTPAVTHGIGASQR